MKEYIKLNCTLWDRVIFFLSGIIPKDVIVINTLDRKPSCGLTEGSMRGGNGVVNPQVLSDKKPKFTPPPPQPFFNDCDEKVESNL